jgi:preprotein translocase subunit SecE
VSQDNVPNKPVHLIYLCGGIILFYLLQWTGDWLWGYFTRTPNEFHVTLVSAVIALATGVILYRRETTYTLVVEVAAECKKVTWPDAKDVRSATIVVIIMTIISASILGFFDLIWSQFTKLIYGG